MPTTPYMRDPITQLAILQLQNGCKDSMQSTLLIQRRFIQMLEMVLDEMIPGSSSCFQPANAKENPWYGGNISASNPNLRIFRIQHVPPPARIYYALATDRPGNNRLWIALVHNQGETTARWNVQPEDPLLTPLIYARLDALYQEIEAKQESLQHS